MLFGARFKNKKNKYINFPADPMFEDWYTRNLKHRKDSYKKNTNQKSALAVFYAVLM